MDSMRSLNTSLPHSSSKAKRSTAPSEELLQSFKNAALSVTNLYRAAEASERRGVQTGYQDALDDLLNFLDKENIGLGDGEGWRVRQWATERLDDTPSPHISSESEEDKADLTTPTSHDRSVDKQMGSSDVEPVKVPPRQSPEPSEEHGIDQAEKSSSDTSNEFTFRAPHQLATDSGPATVGTSDMASSLTVNLHPRTSRTFRGNRSVPRTSGLRTLGSGAGSKRRAPFSEYFDFTDLGNLKKGKFT